MSDEKVTALLVHVGAAHARVTFLFTTDPLYRILSVAPDL